MKRMHQRQVKNSVACYLFWKSFVRDDLDRRMRTPRTRSMLRFRFHTNVSSPAPINATSSPSPPWITPRPPLKTSWMPSALSLLQFDRVALRTSCTSEVRDQTPRNYGQKIYGNRIRPRHAGCFSSKPHAWRVGQFRAMRNASIAALDSPITGWLYITHSSLVMLFTNV
jgi:hypothetical protein